MRRRMIAVVVALTAAIAAIAPVAAPVVEPAAAVTASDWDAGYIISDAQFYNGTAMTAAQIQTFLNAKVPVCDTWHAASGTNTPPFTCLKDYSQSVPTMAATAYCSTLTGASSMTAAEIIAAVGSACNISPAVLLVLLQKEQSLVTDTWPWTSQYNKATGFSCPDSAPCDSAYAGFFYQVYYAARMFQRYRQDPQDFNFRVGGTYAIQYHPSTSCGTLQVTISNAATAGLYNYTPYTPNAAALSNLYGVGDSCSSYGNRNFWRLYADWFGDPKSGGLPGVTVSRIAGSDRYATAAAISATGFPTAGVPVAYVATGEDYPDALAAGAAAADDGGPVILVQRSAIPASSATELARLKPQRIVVVGGTSTIDDTVLAQLASYSVSGVVDRIAGSDRYLTSVEVAKSAFAGQTVSTVFVATGFGFADAVVASAAAGTIGAPVILVPGVLGSVDAAITDAIAAFDNPLIVILGSSVTISTQIEQQLAAVGPTIRLAGSDRYATARAVADFAFSEREPTGVFLATGTNYPDALAGAVVAAVSGAALLTSMPGCVPSSTLDFITSRSISTVTLLGSAATLDSRVYLLTKC